jgi:ketosteroid isomerase-like protein
MSMPGCPSLILALSMLMPAFCIAAGQPTHGVVSAQTRADELIAADRAFAAHSAGIDGLDGLLAAFAEAVVVPVPGKDFANGKAAVAAALRASPAIDRARISWSPVRVGLSVDGDHGFSFGYMSQRQADGTTLPYKYLAYWQRDATGWKAIAWKRGRRADGDVRSTTMDPLLPGRFEAGATVPPLAAAERAFSDEAQTIGLGPAFAKFGTADSMNLGGAGNAGFVFGAEAIAALVSEGQPAGGSTLHWSSDRVVVAASGDLGLSIGHIRYNEAAADGSERPPIPFFTVWRRAASDQPWRYIAE